MIHKYPKDKLFGYVNDLLNETAQGNTNTESGNESTSTSTVGMPTEVAEAVTRDYSDLMKAMDKKK